MFESHAYPGDDRIQSPRTFDTLSLEQRARAAQMSDPQLEDYGYEESPLVTPGVKQRDTVLVEQAVFPLIERVRPAAVIAAETEAAAAARTKRGPVAPSADEVAQAIIAEARTTARSMLAQARDAIAAERAQAVQQGYDEGHAAGIAAADEETAGLVRTCENIGVHVMEERERVLAESEADLVELAISIARRIVNAAIDVDETLVVEACRGAMRKAFQRDSIQVLAHPDDLTLLRDAGPRLADEMGGVEHLDFVEERRLDRGSVIVRTPAGEIDATIRGKAEKIEQALREGIEQRRAERRAA